MPLALSFRYLMGSRFGRENMIPTLFDRASCSVQCTTILGILCGIVKEDKSVREMRCVRSWAAV